MIGSLRGSVIHDAETEVIVEAAGVGYRVVVTPSTRLSLLAESGEITLWIHTQLRQDALVLFGFATMVEREVFEILLTTPGVGPSLALAILGTLGASGVVAAVTGDDPASFESVSGVGKKTAARLVLELGGRLAAFEGFVGSQGRSAAQTEAEERSEISAALSQLGYSTEEVRRGVAILDGSEPIETALRLALRELSHR